LNIGGRLFGCRRHAARLLLSFIRPVHHVVRRARHIGGGIRDFFDDAHDLGLKGIGQVV
jgi:hypothetical protein